MRYACLIFVCGLLAAQSTIRPPEQLPPPAPKPTPLPQTPLPKAPEAAPGGELPADGNIFTTQVDYIVTPVLVFSRDGGYVNNIQPYEFHLYDDDKEQNIQVEVTYTPISLVILVQSNANVEGLLPQVNKIGSLIGPQVIGDAGEAAVIAYDSRIRVLQEFTSDGTKITQAVRKIRPGSTSNRMVDAVVEGTRMLRTRSRDRRRIMLLIGETRDMGSESRARDALIGLQLSNITFYSVDMSRFMTTLTAPPKPARPDNTLPAMRPLPPNVPATPTTVQQMYGINGRAEFIPLLLEIFRDAKAIFKANPVEVFTKGTGGTEFGFHNQRGLETALTAIGEQLHSQYTISYQPNNREKVGFHPIRVEIAGHPEVDKISVKPGYYLGAAK